MYSLGCIKSPETNEESYSQIKSFKEIPSSFENRTLKIKDQGRLGSCVGFAASNIKDTQELINHPGKNYELSPLFIYAECKKIDGIPNTEGTYLHVACDVLRRLGVCLERTFPYSDNRVIRPTPPEAFKEAEGFKIKRFAKVNTLEEVKQAIVHEGSVLGGVFVTSSFMTPERGFVPLPGGSFLGGHAIAFVGYDDNLEFTYSNGRRMKGFVKFANSWGSGWGDRGFGWLPYEFFTYSLLDLPGFRFYMEGWALVDEITPINPAREVIMHLGNRTALVDGAEVILDQEPIADPRTNRTLVPLRQLCEIFGQTVGWNQARMEITIGTRIKMWVDSLTAEVDGKRVNIDQPPVVNPTTWRTLVPVRFVSEILGYSVGWDDNSKRITIRR